MRSSSVRLAVFGLVLTAGALGCDDAPTTGGGMSADTGATVTDTGESDIGPADSGFVDTGSADTGGAVDDTGEAVTDTGSNASEVSLGDGSTRCTASAQCTGDLARVCNLASGMCVECSAAEDNCPTGQRCMTDRCVGGCRTDSDCTADGGTATRCDPVRHVCVGCRNDADCAPGTVCDTMQGERCVAGCNATHPCAMGESCCTGQCLRTQSDAMNCGTCGRVCSAANGAASCSAGACEVTRCDTGFADCDRNPANGCEVGTNTDPGNCGACGTQCSVANGTGQCAGGRCGVATCAQGFGDCDSNPANGCETGTQSSAQHCGMCGRQCSLANSTAACSMGACAVMACNTGFADCDRNPANGCEANTTTDANNCGACGAACRTASGVPSCAAGRCATGSCNAGTGDCDANPANGCEAMLTTLANCGACARPCSPAQGTGSCSATGVCSVVTCSAGFGDCDNSAGNGCEARLASDVNHCGLCGAACAARANTAASCVGRACTYACLPGFGDCDGNPANGCEANFSNTLAHCGGCGRGCTLPNVMTSVCATATCMYSCRAGFADCDGNSTNGCEAQLSADANHCGRCGVSCGTRVCNNSVCAFPVSCADLHRRRPTAPSGIYEIDTDGAGTAAAFQVYCDMTTDGGGWTLVMKLGAGEFCYNNPNWTSLAPVFEIQMLNPTFPTVGGYDAKSRAFYGLTDATGLRFSTSRNNAVTVTFVRASSPMTLMTTNTVPFAAYPDYTAWRAAFGHDRSRAPIFMRAGVVLEAGNICRSNPLATPVGCGQRCTFCFQAGDGACCGCAATAVNDVNSGIGQNPAYCGGGQTNCSTAGVWSDPNLRTLVWAR